MHEPMVNWRDLLTRSRRLWWVFVLVGLVPIASGYMLRPTGWSATTEIDLLTSAELRMNGGLYGVAVPPAFDDARSFARRVTDALKRGEIRGAGASEDAIVRAVRDGTVGVAVRARSKSEASRILDSVVGEALRLRRERADGLAKGFLATSEALRSTYAKRLKEVDAELQNVDRNTSIYDILLSERANYLRRSDELTRFRSIIDALVAEVSVVRRVPTTFAQDSLASAFSIGAAVSVFGLGAAFLLLVFSRLASTRLGSRSAAEQAVGVGSVLALITRGQTDLSVVGAVLGRLRRERPGDIVLVPVGDAEVDNLGSDLDRYLPAAESADPGRVRAAPSLVANARELIEALKEAAHVIVVLRAGSASSAETRHTFETLIAVGNQPTGVVVTDIDARDLDRWIV